MGWQVVQFWTTKQEGHLVGRPCGKGSFAFKKGHQEGKGSVPPPLHRGVVGSSREGQAWAQSVGALGRPWGGSGRGQRIWILSEVSKLQTESPTLPFSRLATWIMNMSLLCNLNFLLLAANFVSNKYIKTCWAFLGTRHDSNPLVVLCHLKH